MKTKEMHNLIAQAIQNHVAKSNSKYATNIKNAQKNDLAYALSIGLYSGLRKNIPLTSVASKVGFHVLPKDFGKTLTKGQQNKYKVRVGTLLLNALHEEKLIHLKRQPNARGKKKKPASRRPYIVTEVNKDFCDTVIGFASRMVGKLESQATEVQFTPPKHYDCFWHPVQGDMVRNCNQEVMPDYNMTDYPHLFESVNRQMQTAYKINRRVLRTVLHCLQDDIFTLDGLDLDDEQKESIYRERVETLTRAINIGDKTFWQYMFLDFRLRLYSSTIFLTSTGSKLSRSLFYSDKTKEVGERGYRWLYINAASLWGYDKQNLEARYQYAQSKKECWLEIAKDPINNKVWQTADSPFEFLAAILEIRAMENCKDPYSFQSGLFVAQDQSNSGSQHLNGLAGIPREEEAALCNLVKGTDKGDTYLATAEWVYDRIEVTPQDKELYDEVTATLVALDKRVDEAIRLKKKTQSETAKKKVTAAFKARAKYCKKHAKTIYSLAPVFWMTKEEHKRSTSKRSTMCYSYSISAKGMGKHILKDNAHKPAYKGLNSAYSHWMGHQLYKACQNVLKTNTEVMQLLTYIGVQEHNKGRQLRYISPLGVPVMHNYFEDSTSPMEIKIGSKRARIRVAVGSRDKMNYKKAKQSSAVNYVHACDASHLHLVRLSMECPMLLVHDSFATLAADSDELHVNARLTFVQMHEEDHLIDFLGQTGYADLYHPDENVIKYPGGQVTLGKKKFDGIMQNDFFCS